MEHASWLTLEGVGEIDTLSPLKTLPPSPRILQHLKKGIIEAIIGGREAFSVPATALCEPQRILVSRLNLKSHGLDRVYGVKTNLFDKPKVNIPFNARPMYPGQESLYCWNLTLGSCISSSMGSSQTALSAVTANGDPSQLVGTVMFTLHPNESQINDSDILISILVSLTL